MQGISVLYNGIMFFIWRQKQNYNIIAAMTFFSGFITDGNLFLYFILCPLLIVNKPARNYYRLKVLNSTMK